MDLPLLYKTTFGADGIKISSWKDTESSKASLENLRPLIPGDVDLSRNIDLLSVAFNGANPGLVNKNDDCIDVATAIQILDLCRHKSLNLEHQSKKIVGHIITAGLSRFGDSKLITPEEALESEEPVNMAFGGVVYQKIFPEFGKLLEKTQEPDNPLYHSVATSWEIMFDSYNIVLGSKNLKEAEIISDPKKVAELKNYLRKYGGEGKLKDGTPVYRQVKGKNVLPTAFGFVLKPAAFVNGVLVAGTQKSSATISNFIAPAKKSVKPINSHNLMDLEQILQNLDAKLDKALAGNEAEEAQANLAKEIAPQLKALNEQWKTDRNNALKVKEDSEAKVTELYAQVEKISKTLAEANQKLWEMEENSRATKTLIRFNERMAAMDEKYDMDDEDRCVVASELKTLEVKEDETGKDLCFAAYEEKMAKLWKHKDKQAIAKAKADFDAKVESALEARIKEVSTASQVKKGEENATVEEALEKAKANKEESVIPNNNEEAGSEGKSLVDQFKAKFTKDSITVK